MAFHGAQPYCKEDTEEFRIAPVQKDSDTTKIASGIRVGDCVNWTTTFSCSPLSAVYTYRYWYGSKISTYIVYSVTKNACYYVDKDKNVVPYAAFEK
jgi:hypothetical protein